MFFLPIYYSGVNFLGFFLLGKIPAVAKKQTPPDECLIICLPNYKQKATLMGLIGV